jgi:Icc-related predicted phosphoesterase
MANGALCLNRFFLDKAGYARGLMIKVIAVSDMHGELPEITPCDLLLLGGDICPGGSPSQEAKWLAEDFKKWLEKVPAEEIVGIAGNHDFVFEHPELFALADLRWHYLKDSLTELFGLKIYGTPWQLPFWGAFNVTEDQLVEKYSTIPKGIDILLSHSPPYGILDQVHGRHCGSKALLQKVFEIQPKLFVCGHIHDAYGKCVKDGITFANVALLNDEMEVAHLPMLFEL